MLRRRTPALLPYGAARVPLLWALYVRLSRRSADPELPTKDCVRLRNCPFHSVADVAPELVCGMNQSFISGLLAGLRGHRSVQATLEPAPPNCCVVLSRRT